MRFTFDVMTALVLGVLAFNTPTWADDDEEEEFYDAQENQPVVGVWGAMKNAAKNSYGAKCTEPQAALQGIGAQVTAGAMN